MDVRTIVRRLGGPSKVAELCACTPQAVSRWYTRHGRIPDARLLHLMAVRPDVFDTPPSLARPRRRKDLA